MTQYFSRAAKSLVLRQGPPDYEEVQGFEAPAEPAKVAAYSPDGSRFAYATVTATYIVDPDTGKTIATVPVSAADIYFSPKGSFLVTWVRPQKNQETGNFYNNLKVWRVSDPSEPVGEYLQKGEGSMTFGWSVQWTADEKFCIRQASRNALVACDPTGKTVQGKLEVPDGISQFMTSPGRNPAVAVFVLGTKGKPASVRVYKIPALSHPVAQRTFFKAESVQFMWNKLGTALIVNAIVDVDHSGKSYYGESTLYLLSVNNGADQRIMLDKEGPVHDVSWSATSDEFGVVYGYMPSKTTFFNARGNEVHSLPLASRNTIKFSPQGRFVVVAGFGNLQGQVDIYDRAAKYNKVASIQAPNTSFFDWSPCGKYLLTATTSPRLRVDNGVRLWHYTGKFMYSHDDTELFTVAWRPQEIPLVLTDGVPEPHSSIAGKKVPSESAPKGAYRPPHARSTGGEAVRTSLYQRSMVSEQGTTELSKTAAKNKKKRENKKAGDSPAAASKTPEPVASIATPEEKHLRSLLKKLRAISELKQRQAAGDSLEQTQVQKIATEDDVLKKLEGLGWSGSV